METASVVRLPFPITAAAMALAWAGAAQSLLPPGVLLLSRVKAHMRQELARLPNCSCLETVRRQHQPAGGTIRPLDTVRLEVLYSEHKELYASPGDRGFGYNQPMDFVGSGSIGNGHFALFLSEAVSEHGLACEYKGEETLQGRRLARYDYRVPANLSGHTVSLPEGKGTVGEKGSFWADPATYDIVHISIEAEEIPPELPVAAYVTSIDYAHTILGGTDFLLPQSADSRLTRFSGEESRNHIEFTHCHLFGAQSSVSFADTHGFPLFGASSVLELGRELLPALPVVVKLSTPITEQTTVGALIEGVVALDVPHKKKLLIPAGSPVRGRVRRLEWNLDKGGYFIVGLEFTELEAAGTRYRFFADLEGTDGLPGLRQTIATTRKKSYALPNNGGFTIESDELIFIPSLPGVGTFFVQARSLDLPPGFRMAWRTRALVP